MPRAANDVSLREMRNDARLRRMMRFLRQHSGGKPSVFDFIVFDRATNRSLPSILGSTDATAAKARMAQSYTARNPPMVKKPINRSLFENNLRKLRRKTITFVRRGGVSPTGGR